MWREGEDGEALPYTLLELQRPVLVLQSLASLMWSFGPTERRSWISMWPSTKIGTVQLWGRKHQPWIVPQHPCSWSMLPWEPFVVVFWYKIVLSGITAVICSSKSSLHLLIAGRIYLPGYKAFLTQNTSGEVEIKLCSPWACTWCYHFFLPSFQRR